MYSSSPLLNSFFGGLHLSRQISRFALVPKSTCPSSSRTDVRILDYTGEGQYVAGLINP